MTRRSVSKLTSRSRDIAEGKTSLGLTWFWADVSLDFSCSLSGAGEQVCVMVVGVAQWCADPGKGTRKVHSEYQVGVLKY